MNNTQLYLAIAIPSYLVLFSLLTNMVQINRLSDKLNRNYEKLSDRMYRLAEQQHKDSLALQGYMIPFHDRMAVIEAKQK